MRSVSGPKLCGGYSTPMPVMERPRSSKASCCIVMSATIMPSWQISFYAERSVQSNEGIERKERAFSHSYIPDFVQRSIDPAVWIEQGHASLMHPFFLFQNCQGTPREQPSSQYHWLPPFILRDPSYEAYPRRDARSEQ